MKRLGAIVQARMSSERLPGKVLRELKGGRVLEHLIRRLLCVFEREFVVIATSDQPSDDLIIKAAAEQGIRTFRGSLEDVLDRYYQCASQFNFDPLVSITADNPLIETTYLKALIKLFETSRADYASAKDPRSFPRGTTAEIFTFKALERAWRDGKTTEDREHVTWYFGRHPEKFKIAYLKSRPEWSPIPFRLALDEPQDLTLLETIFDRLYDQNPLFGLTEIYALYEQEPELFEINREIKPRMERILP